MSPFKDKEHNREYQRSWKAAKRAEAKAAKRTATHIETPCDHPASQPVISASDRARIDYLRNYIKSLESGSRKGQADEMRNLSRTYGEIADRLEAELNTAIANARAELLRLIG